MGFQTHVFINSAFPKWQTLRDAERFLEIALISIFDFLETTDFITDAFFPKMHNQNNSSSS